MRANLQSIIAGAGLAVALSASAFAAEIAPTDVKFTDDGVKESLSGAAGDAANGRKVFADRKLGNCLACHAVDDQKDQLFHGNVGPELNGVADRYDAAQLRGIITNAKKTFEDTIMPGFYTLEVGKDVREKSVGKTILSAQEVEDVVAYLATLKE
ncbi:MAG: sulfur oxidation c-type cytochrome SoxX [Anderseniella sp.]|jgi:sulfur-oxidizing protein SoxX|nr:sulfur oxidation c-type cytochrome SoxX [Anderseniella sp.]